MAKRDELVLVLGATGRQGGATARALKAGGFRVRALVRDPEGPKARALSGAGVEVVRGDLRDRGSIERALRGVYGVFSVQPTSAQPEYEISDKDEVRFGTEVADAAKAAGVEHFVYASAAGASADIGLSHIETKWHIEEHVRGLGVDATVVRPSTFMEVLALPYFGLARGELTFFLAPDGAAQFIAVEDVGALVAHVFAARGAYAGKTVELAGDSLTGGELAAKIGRATGRAVSYARFPAEALRESALLKRLVELADEGRMAGAADVGALRVIHPGLLTFDAWLEKAGKALLSKLFGAAQG